MPNDSPYSIDYLVRGFDCGWGGPLQVLPLVNYLQEAAGDHAIELGFGIPELNRSGLTWMLARIDLRVDRLPGWRERVRVRTWPSGLDRLLALRDIILETESGEPLVRAVYAYLVVDVAKRRPLRPERTLPGHVEAIVETAEHCVPDFAFGVEPLVAGSRHLSFAERAAPRHRDDNGHVNNAHIVDWLVDAAPESLRGAGLATARVDFIKEVLVGDEVTLVHGVEGLVTEALRGDECVARARLSWRAR